MKNLLKILLLAIIFSLSTNSHAQVVDFLKKLSDAVESFVKKNSTTEDETEQDKPNTNAQLSLPPCTTGYKHNCFGTATLRNGNKYVGEFRDDKFHGQGTYTWSNGEKYVGEFRDGNFHGQGTYTFPDGRKHVGEYRDDNFNGQGTYTWPDGRTYVGEYRDDKFHGQGTYTWPDGRTYVGEYRDDKFHGQGTYTWPDGRKHVGEYRDGNFHGQGTYTWPDGAKYVGEYRDDKRNGQGTYTFSNGGKYVGEFRDGSFHGQGIQYRADGSIARSGEWFDDKLVRSFSLNTNRFPFGASPVIAQASVQSPSQGGSASAERERLAAEIAAGRLKRQEAVEQLSREREWLSAASESPQRQPQPAVNRNERRVALVIGNSGYRNSPLSNPVNDASDLDVGLRALGFKTTLLRDATIAQMREATRKFFDEAATSDVALIFFAGHGIESKGRNYLIPVSADIKYEYELEDQAYDAGRWLDMLDSIKGANRQRVNIVIIDACRNNDLHRGWRSASRGLARMDAPTGTFVAFATAPGKVALDGAMGQRNSPFTKSLLKAIQTPDVPIELIFKDVRRMVLEETKNEQVPWDNSSLVGDFVFRRTR
jgi:hypothetical protein